MDFRPFTLERYFAPREFTARAHLSCSDCEPVALAGLVAGADDDARALWVSLKLGYSETRGHPLLRAEVAQLYRATGVTVDDVICAVPAEGILLTMLALLEPSDAVVVAVPAYQSLYEIARAKGCTIREWRAREARDCWRFDPAELRKIVDGAKLVVVNFPHNPTGAHPTQDEWGEIVDIVEQSGAWLFSDEMYRFLEPELAQRLPAAVEMMPRGISLGGLSKSMSAPGLRSGWIACKDRALVDRVAMFKDYTTICGSAPSEILSIIALRARKRLVGDNLGRIAASVARVVELGLDWKPPRAGCVALMRVEGSASALCDELLKRGLLGLPSTVFDMGDEHIRLGLGRDGFPAAVTELR